MINLLLTHRKYYSIIFYFFFSCYIKKLSLFLLVLIFQFTFLSNTAPEVGALCVSCESNGHYMVTRSRSISFEGTCIGCDAAVLQWTITENGTGNALTVDSTQTTTGTDQLNFVLRSGVIQDHKAYIFKLKATSGSQSGTAEIVLAPSTKPSTGSCTLSPSAGVIVLTDKVTYSCSNVVDSDTLSAIYYKVTVRSTTSYKTPYIAYYGTKSVNSFYAVPFPGTIYGSVQIEISAVNFYGAETVLYTRYYYLIIGVPNFTNGC